MNSITELKKALAELIVNIYYSCYDRDSMVARKQTISTVIGSMDSIVHGLNKEEILDLAEYVNKEIFSLYERWKHKIER